MIDFGDMRGRCAQTSEGGYLHRLCRELNQRRQRRPEEETAPGWGPFPWSTSGGLFGREGRDAMEMRLMVFVGGMSRSAGGGETETAGFCLVIPIQL